MGYVVSSPLPDQVKVHRRMVELGGLRKFTELAFPQVEPRTYQSNWHIHAICDHLEAVSRAEIKNLIINIPPGCMKSLTVGVFWPVWTWIEDPAFKFIFGSYSASLTRRDAVRSRDLINSRWFQDRWGFLANPENGRPDEEHPSDPRRGWGVSIPWQNTRAAQFYENNHKGFRFSTSIGGEVTGRHANALVIDDPNKAQHATGGRAATGVELQNAVDFWTGTMSTRQADPRTTRKVIIMQRLHAKDLAGAMADTGEYVVLCLPMEFDPKRRCVTVIGFEDPRTQPGQLLWPERFDEAAVNELKTAMGPITAAAQLDQNPTPVGGAIFKADWLLKTWKVLPANCQFFQSWDCTFKDEQESDWVVGQVWARKGAQYFLVDQIREKLNFPATVQAIIDMKAKWPKTSAIWIEDKANGPAIISTLQKKIPGLVPVDPQGGKEARANAVTAYFEAGNVYLPEEAPWLLDWRSEMVKFPRDKNDDQVDATTQALIQLAGHPGDRIRKAMEEIQKRNQKRAA